MSIRERVSEFWNRIKDFGRSFFGADTEVGDSGDPETLKNSVMEAVKKGEMSKQEAEEIFKAYKNNGDRAEKFNGNVEKGVTLLPSEQGESPFIEQVDTPHVERGEEGTRAKGGREIDE